jgi:serine/threonine-protein kinase
MPLDSVADWVEVLRRTPLLTPAQIDELTRDLEKRFPDPRALARELLRRGWLTPYQINQLAHGRGPELVLGPYLLLERLGEGGMGQVFKARHQKLERVVALKVIRKERLAHPDAVRRFHREVRAAAQLSHLHVVHAYDADEVGGTHFFAMEYVEGTDLAALCKQRGPLPVREACEYVRQAALGLQHAHERGLVHRDVKPSNLLLAARDQVVKVLDMGLARLADRGGETDSTSALTAEGAVMGTPDYLAPEQTLDSHTVDIRADLYSLGCTLYYLLSGRVPFPGGSLGQKLIRHQLREPESVEQLRPEVPAAVAAVVRKLMAKKPEERYQTPAEAAAALAAVLAGDDRSFAPATTEGDRTAVGSLGLEPTLTEHGVGITPLDTGGTAEAAGPGARRRQAAESRRLLLYSVAGGGVLLGLLLLLAVLLRGGRGSHEARPTADDALSPFEKWRKDVARMPARQQVRAVLEKLQALNRGFDGRGASRINGGVVTGLTFLTDHVTDSTPLRALTGLKTLTCKGSAPGKGKLVDLSPLWGLRLTALDCSNTRVKDLAPLRRMPLAVLHCDSTQVTDLDPLRELPLKDLSCIRTGVADLAPLKDLPLTRLSCSSTLVSDLAPLQGLPLNYLASFGTRISDLKPLRGLPLTVLNCAATDVTDLTPLKGMRLTYLDCRQTRVVDLTPLQGMPLQDLWCDFRPWRDAEQVRAIKTLVHVNGMQLAEFWKKATADRIAFEQWVAEVRQMPPGQQAKAAADKLEALNRGFDGRKVNALVNNGLVYRLNVPADQVTDLSPLRALADLRVLSCNGSAPGKGQLFDLSPLQGMSLKVLVIGNTAVVELAPLRGMKLMTLHCNNTRVADLSPLRDMPLAGLNCNNTRVADLSPLKGMKLQALHCGGTKVADLSPLQGMPLTQLACHGTPVTDLSPLKGMKLTTLYCNSTHVANLSPLRGMPLQALYCSGCRVKDLSPLRGMRLKVLNCTGQKIDDLSPLQGMPLQELWATFPPRKNAALLQSIRTLVKINKLPVAQFWQRFKIPFKPQPRPGP